MVSFHTVILQFDEQGEKTGWTYINIPAGIAAKLNPGCKKSFRVKGKLDEFEFGGIALVPMGDGNFIMALNATVRRAIKKRKGASLQVQMELDTRPVTPPPDLKECLEDEPAALAFFNSLLPGHRTYYIKWLETAKTEPTRIKRIAQMVNALSKKQGFPEMIRAGRKENS